MNRNVNFILVCALCSSFSYADVVSIRADAWYPINGDAGSEKPGYMIEIAEAILTENGHSLDYQTMPWERSLTEVRAGKYDCVVGATPGDAEDFIFPEESWGAFESTFYVKKGNGWRYTDLDSVKNIKVGVIGGYAYSDEFDAYVAANKANAMVQVLNANNALEQNIKKLNAGRIDAVVESHLVMNAKLMEMGLVDNITSAGALTESEPIFIACSPAKASSKIYSSLFSGGIQKLRASGQLKTILDKYGLTDWK
ncbi:ABC transporter, periplasmic domain [Shewanella denitrificans OS217]|uniref:ABC transporter, periplasmic domain n=1 Tax=Shewanella denitrificans (strain OS217 / ATCC BAA-1090 / DSM 15013) TaxID=318161 RepID=Q12NV9_SHEDO|nr:transporter substrate-binding domain-containing protein [Shewanella denitrificans]ABE54867.1 ABC transporter, periplasmic domain [Shewanella denitrificans OS217]